MSGALAERVFADKLHNVGFVDLDVLEREPWGLEDAVRYPLFTADLVELMYELIPPAKQREIAVSVTLTATKPRVG